MSFVTKSVPGLQGGIDLTSQAVAAQLAPEPFDWSQPSTDWLSDSSGDVFGPGPGAYDDSQGSGVSQGPSPLSSSVPRTGRAFVGHAIHQHTALFGARSTIGGAARLLPRKPARGW
jgi:hypothetical protein